MTRWLTSAFLVLTFAGSVFAGTPLHFGKADNSMSMMRCCKAAKKRGKAATRARLCCALNCTESAPTAPSNSQFNFTPHLVFTTHSTTATTVLPFTTAAAYYLDAKTLSRTNKPKYIKHLSLLI